MPKLLIWNGHKFHFYSGDGGERPHVHIRKGRQEAKIWLDVVEVADRGRYSDRELSDFVRIVEDHRDEFLEAWNAFFN